MRHWTLRMCRELTESFNAPLPDPAGCRGWRPRAFGSGRVKERGEGFYSSTPFPQPPQPSFLISFTKRWRDLRPCNPILFICVVASFTGVNSTMEITRRAPSNNSRLAPVLEPYSPRIHPPSISLFILNKETWIRGF